MGEILGLSMIYYYRGLTAIDEGVSSLWQHIINAPLIDPKWKDQRNWPEGMLEEVGNDKGLSAAGHHEMLNRHVLAGGMETLERKPDIIEYVETFIFQSDKCFAAFLSN